MDWLNAIMGQMGQKDGGTPAVGESYMTEMDRMKQQKALMEALRSQGMNRNRQDRMIGGGRNGSFGDRPGILVPGNNAGTALADVMQTAMGQYGAGKADKGMGDLAGRNDAEFAARLEQGGFPQGNGGNFPQALPQQQPVQGATPGMPGAPTPPDSSFTEAPFSGAEMIQIAKMRKEGMSDAAIAEALTAGANGGEAPAPAAPEPEMAAPDVPAISASIPASGNMEPTMSGREKWMIQMAHDFPKTAPAMNSMLQAEANSRRDQENAPLKMALAEMRVNQAADLAASRAASQKELEAIRQQQRVELERIRQENRVDLKKTAAPARPAAAKPGAAGGAPGAGGGANAFDGTLAMMREMYANLDKSGGITNSEKGRARNVKAFAMSSVPGQVLGQALGTQNQSWRNTIVQSRPLLVRGIAEATGMSAKNLDSNAELKLWLDTVSSPSIDIQANMRALDNIEAWVNAKRSGAPAPTEAAAGKTIVREVKLKDGRTGVEYSDGSKGFK